MSNQSN